jgi:hypothetical protein
MRIISTSGGLMSLLNGDAGILSAKGRTVVTSFGWAWAIAILAFAFYFSSSLNGGWDPVIDTIVKLRTYVLLWKIVLPKDKPERLSGFQSMRASGSRSYRPKCVSRVSLSSMFSDTVPGHPLCSSDSP